MKYKGKEIIVACPSYKRYKVETLAYIPFCKVYVSPEEYEEYYFTLPIENKGTAEIYDGELLLYFWKGDKVIGVRTERLDGIVGGETTNRKIWVGSYQVDGEYVIPDGVTVDYNYANILADH